MPFSRPAFEPAPFSFWKPVPLATLGLAIVLLLLTGFVMSAAFASHHAADRARVAGELSSKFEQARFAIGAEESLERKYRLEPAARIRSAHAKAAKALSAALNSVRLTGSEEDRALVAHVTAMHTRYLDALRRMFDAVDARDSVRVLQIDRGEVDPLFDHIEKDVKDASAEHHADATQSLSDLGKTESFVFNATPVVFGVGLFLLTVFAIILRGYRKRANKAYRRESERIKESALLEIERLKLAVEAEHQVLVTRDALQGQKSAEDANLAKTEFLSRMSHELRTPMNAILGFGQILGADKSLSFEQHDSVNYILKGGKHLLTLINELLDITRIEGGYLISALEIVSTQELFATLLELLAPLIAERDLRVSGLENCHGCVMADPQRLKQVLLNLLSNAIKYNRLSGRIVVACRPGEDDYLRLEVSDTGKGIAAEDLSRVFTPFERLGAERTAIEGTGIGLTLSQRLVEAMDGALTVQSKPGEGSTFTVHLPVAREIERPAEAALKTFVPPRREPGAGCTLLYIEDDPSNQELLRLILLERPEIHLSLAGQGELGLEMARRDRPDLVLLDLQLPDMPGLEVLAALRAGPTTALIPVVILSADATKHVSDQLLAAGADAYLAKPFKVSELLDTVDEVLGMRALRLV